MVVCDLGVSERRYLCDAVNVKTHDLVQNSIRDLDHCPAIHAAFA